MRFAKAIRRLTATLILCSLLSLLLAGCGASTASSSTTLQQGSSPPPHPQLITFADSVSYAQALRTVTDLGLQPDLNCGEGWRPNGQRTWFASNHGLIVELAYLSSAPDWGPRLEATPGVVSIQNVLAQPSDVPTAAPLPDTFEYICPTPTAVIPQLTHENDGAFAQIVFDSTQSYDSALYIVSDLGLHLADPCYEQALLAQKSPAWQQQLGATPGVARIVTPYTARC